LQFLIYGPIKIDYCNGLVAGPVCLDTLLIGYRGCFVVLESIWFNPSTSPSVPQHIRFQSMPDDVQWCTDWHLHLTCLNCVNVPALTSELSHLIVAML